MCKHKKNLHPLYPPPPQKKGIKILIINKVKKICKKENIYTFTGKMNQVLMRKEKKKTLRSRVASTKNLLVEARIWMNCNQLWWGTEIADYKER